MKIKVWILFVSVLLTAQVCFSQIKLGIKLGASKHEVLTSLHNEGYTASTSHQGEDGTNCVLYAESSKIGSAVLVNCCFDNATNECVKYSVLIENSSYQAVEKLLLSAGFVKNGEYYYLESKFFKAEILYLDLSEIKTWCALFTMYKKGSADWKDKL